MPQNRFMLLEQVRTSNEKSSRSVKRRKKRKRKTEKEMKASWTSTLMTMAVFAARKDTQLIGKVCSVSLVIIVWPV